MQIDSVRNLKAGLFKSIIAPLMTAAPQNRAIALSAQPMAGITGSQRAIALGVARKGANDFQLAVRVQRPELMNGPQLDEIRKQAKNEADVRYIGRVVKRASAAPWNQKPQRPLLMGTSIGHYKITAGTLGCFVKRRTDGAILILSNNHVLADENRAKPGDAILQPGKYDGGKNPASAAGRLDNFIKLKKIGPNLVDCAVASIKRTIKFNHQKLTGLGALAGLGPAVFDGDAVSKVGRTTGVTHGKVTAVEMDNVIVGYGIGEITFNGQIEIEGAGNASFSAGGDSGSLIVDADMKAVALLFAGTDQGGSNSHGLTYANLLTNVLDALKVDLHFA